MRIALINTPSLSERPVSRSMAGGLGFDGGETMLLPPLDLAILASTLRAEGHDVVLIDADPVRLTASDVLRQLGPPTWNIIVATVSLPTLDQDAAFLRSLAAYCPQARIWGKTLVRDPQVLETLLRSSQAVGILHGELDLTIGSVLTGQERAGTAWLEPAGPGESDQFRIEQGEPVQDLNRLPLPARDLLPNEQYVYPLLDAPVATLQTSRGCPYPCGYYCPYPLVEGVKWRAQTAERILRELDQVVTEYGIRNIYFRDATFTLNQQRILDLCAGIQAKGWALKWMCETRVDCLSDEVVKAMASAGCVGILIGVESGDEQVMHSPHGKKGLTIPRLAHLRTLTRELNIRLHFLLIVGLPEETRESIVSTYDLVQRYQPDTIGVTIITPYPGTPLYQEGVAKGWVDSTQWSQYGGHQVVMHTPNLTQQDLQQGQRFIQEGFALLQRRLIGGHSLPLQALADRHYETLLRWAYQLDDEIIQLKSHRLRRAEPLTVPVKAPALPAAAPTGRTSPIPAAGSRPQISVIIPTYNRRAILRKTLLGFASQTIPPDQFEVIVVDDGSPDDTVPMVTKLTSSLGIRLTLIAAQHQGANAARNAGLQAAQAPVVLITGDDMIPSPNLVECHLAHHQANAEEQDAMLGLVEWSPDLPSSVFRHFLVSPGGGQQFAFYQIRSPYVSYQFFYTCNVSVKRDWILRQPVVFDPDFTYPAYDDTELGYRLAKQGLRLFYNAKAVTYHHHELDLESFVRRQRMAGRMAVVFAGKHPELAETLGVTAVEHHPQATEEAHLRQLIDVICELEKPDLATLRGIHIGNQAADQYYLAKMLYPLYNGLLDAAYKLGIHEQLHLQRTQAPTTPPAPPVELPLVSIVIPVFNKLELTQQCLMALSEVTQGIPFEVIIVDNASADGTFEWLRSVVSGDLQVIRNEHNLGFAKACNQGAAAARAPYVLFLNNDTIPLQGWLAPMVQEVQQDPTVAIVGSKLLYPDGTIQHAGVAFSRYFPTPYHVFAKLPATHPAVNQRQEFQVVTAACMLVRKTVFEQVGGFDEGYWCGFEDVDFCLAVKQLGHKVVYQPHSVLYHLESQTPGRKAKDAENAARLIARWGHRWWGADEDQYCIAHGQHPYLDRSITPPTLRFAPILDGERPAWDRFAKLQRCLNGQDWDAARAMLRSHDPWPNDDDTTFWLARLTQKLGCTDLAYRYWKDTLNYQDTPEARLALADMDLASKQFADAKQHIQAVLKQAPDHGEAWRLMGLLSLCLGKRTEAREGFKRAALGQADPLKCELGLALVDLDEQQYSSVWSRCERILDQEPGNLNACRLLVTAGQRLSQWTKMIPRLHNFLQHHPGDTHARYAQVLALTHCGPKQAAQQACRALYSDAPDFPDPENLRQQLNACSV